MRTITSRIAVVMILLATASCGRLADEPYHKDGVVDRTHEYEAVATTHFKMNMDVSVIRSKRTGCQFIWANGSESGGLTQRLDHDQPMCGSAGDAVFEMLSQSNMGRLDVYVLRDVTTGCHWIWADGNRAVSIMPETRGRTQICDGTPGRRVSPVRTAPKDDD